MRERGCYDLAVIGAGSAGFSAAITAAELGAQVALIGHGTIGGTCVNTGCVPSKNLIRATEPLHSAAAADRFGGIRAEARIEDWRSVKRGKDVLVDSLRRAKYIDLLPAYNSITYVEGRARFSDGGIIVGGRPLKTGKVVIATGASPALPPIPGIEGVPYLTSTTALDLKRLPQSLLVIGGGYIDCELGQMFARAGVAMTIVDLVPILSAGEPEISAALARYLREEGMVIRESVTPMAISETPGGIALEISAGGKSEALEAEQLLITTGRRPNTAGLGLYEAGVELLPNGGIRVDDHMRTRRVGTYAAGDATGRDQFVHMAAYGARIAAENALGGDGKRYDATAMPSVVFTDPQNRERRVDRGASRRARPGGDDFGSAARSSAAGAGRARHAGPLQARRASGQRQAPRGPPAGARGRRQHPNRRARDQSRLHNRGASRHDLPLPDHRRRIEARRPKLSKGRDEALLLRRIGRRYGRSAPGHPRLRLRCLRYAL